MNELTDEQRVAVDVIDAVNGLFDEENENYAYDLHEIDLTKFLTGVIIANSIFYQQVTGEDVDLVEFIGFQNKLVVQYLLESNKN